MSTVPKPTRATRSLSKWQAIQLFIHTAPASLRILLVILAIIGVGTIGYTAVRHSRQHSQPTTVAALFASPPAAPTPVSSEMKALWHVRDAWLADAQLVVDKTKDSEAAAVLQFLRTNGVTAVPRQDGLHLEGQMDDREIGPLFFALAPITSAMTNLGPMWEDMMSASAFAMFKPDLRALIVRDNVPTSRLWRGIILLHEGLHAKTYLEQQYDWQDFQTFCKKEREAHVFQNRIVAKLGGAAYEPMFQAELERCVTISDPAHYTGGRYNVALTVPQPKLADAFGPALSPLEEAFRATHLNTHANFEMWQKYSPNAEVAADRQALLLAGTYQRLGLMPSQ